MIKPLKIRYAGLNKWGVDHPVDSPSWELYGFRSIRCRDAWIRADTSHRRLFNSLDVQELMPCSKFRIRFVDWDGRFLGVAHRIYEVGIKGAQKRGLDMTLKNIDDNEEVCYWRKANQIRGWLVSHNIIFEQDNCIPRLVTSDTLKQLVDDCKKVLENHDLAPELLPTTDGFFFGSMGYDEWYFEELERTVSVLEPLAATEKNYIYSDWY